MKQGDRFLRLPVSKNTAEAIMICRCALVKNRSHKSQSLTKVKEGNYSVFFSPQISSPILEVDKVSELFLKAEHLTKDYPGTRALDDISISFQSGKVNALVGKNGSGKSTLVKIFAGAVSPTSGSILLNDEKLTFDSTSEANAKGIVTVYQEMSLVPGLSVAENIFLGRLPKNSFGHRLEKTYQMADSLLKKMKVDIDPRETLYRLSMWQMQVVEITKALSFDPKVIMLG